ncbi:MULTISPECIES: ATP-dependent Clp protease ATP-binding subunit ClpX [Myxococcus]|nr:MULTISPECIES: ATP-dependent Clp protease ATP-binding subunit ClpX [Myxococcus]NOJ54231.1 ATP-dependent Clp protease ATP-binding subunit ClpX [Myxococcus xanthus]QPM82243.1 ATP-dependent Clp protease ATP-binding subunit ClpX [Myxococcus xanthus]QVW71491.1 ATP-dependent Clp protease ATP-binding subunit ClpX [Myxococcus xanthus DZ2]QZZ50468.1 ATP-dependent Clp protease ATP-binding subunit ClpX [Myxococcus xanthus]UEO02379.1 ATP-dependent Clp protease ATP-binding subunit ClpX [Myxococcus xanthu
MESSARREEALLTPREIYERLDRFVIGQDGAKRAVAIAAHNHLKRLLARRLRRTSLIKKSNILLMGPTGSGKTHIARNLADILHVPFTTVDATEYTEAGYYGKDVEVMISDLLFKANHSVEDTQRGIIFIDEVDKIARRSQGARNGAGSRDIGGEGVQQSLLKLLEGREVYVPLNVTQAWNKSDFVQVDTRDILFICAGTFSDLHDDGDEGRRAMGFGAEDSAKRSQKRISTRQLTDFGMLAEFLGRLPVVVQLERLGEEDLMRVLTEPPDSIVREFRELLSMDDLEVDFADPGLREVVRYSVERGLGARGLRSVLEHVMADVMFEAPERRRRQVMVDAGFVRERLRGLDSTQLDV